MLLATLLCLQTPTDEVLGYLSENLAKGAGNWYQYYRFSDQKLKIQAGDKLVYEIFLDPKNPSAKGGIDIEFDQGAPLRDRKLDDQNGIRVHGDGVLTPAIGKWYKREISLQSATNQTALNWELVFEGDEAGWFAQYVDNVGVTHSDGSTTWIYRDGLPKARVVSLNNGYTANPYLAALPKARLTSLEGAGNDIKATAERVRALDKVRRNIDLAKQFLARNPDPHLEAHIKEAAAAMEAVERNGNATEKEIQAALHAAEHALSHTHPVMEKYTGHLVGHAHIDLQWLWDWQEGIVATYDTFNQAVKFMDEFPGFTFSQSSSCLYKTVEENYPELFKQIQTKVKKGQWELVGGRICEGDTNMISPESHARHFLYGQRYFREKFGKTAVVGWEPDTFGHTIQMPQILKLGGCDYYYFCRAGKGKPLFWWAGLDGTKILTFEEPATGSWYNSDLSYKQFEEMLQFEPVSGGSKDMLWVYGVGNHGGGPTREYIQEALSWMKDKSKPKVKFSTATEFFKKLETYNLKVIPTIKDELNPVFEGCYTSHAEVKDLNRAAEYSTMSAEAVSTLASFFGFKYPREEFRRSWEDITFHHHHDTLPGSGIHSPYEKTKTQLRRVIAENHDISQRALETMTLRVTPPKGGISVMVANPNGWTRSGWVETYLVASGWSGMSVDLDKAVAVSPDGKEWPVQLIDGRSKLARFYAGDIPAYGYRVFNIRSAKVNHVEITPDADVLENQHLRAEIDPQLGCIVRLYDKDAKREVVPPGGSLGRLEYHFEKPTGMSAWVLGQIDRVQPLTTYASSDYIYSFSTVAHNDAPKETRIRQTFSLLPGSRQIDVEVRCDWQNIGLGSDGCFNPMLRVAFDFNAINPIATYEVPFGALSRPTDGKEVVGLNWANVAGLDYGLAVLNDGKSGMSCTGNTLRLSMIRSSYDPDPVPNPGLHTWRYAIVPHTGDWKQAQIPRKGMEFNQPLLSAWVPFDARGDKPLEWSPLNFSDSKIVPTAMKLAESDNDLVVRFYQSTGAPSNSALQLNLPVQNASWVNFIEDTVGKAASNAGNIGLQMRPWEIRTVKIGIRGRK